jgi:hypothetical protein
MGSSGASLPTRGAAQDPEFRFSGLLGRMSSKASAEARESCMIRSGQVGMITVLQRGSILPSW